VTTVPPHLKACDLLEPKLYKYVRMADGTMRFTEVLPFGRSHSELVAEGEEPVSAGMVGLLAGNQFNIPECGSRTLGLYGERTADADCLEQLLGRDYRPECSVVLLRCECGGLMQIEDEGYRCCRCGVLGNPVKKELGNGW